MGGVGLVRYVGLVGAGRPEAELPELNCLKPELPDAELPQT